MVMFNVVNWEKTISFVLDLLAFIHTLQLELLEALQVCAVPRSTCGNVAALL